MEEQKQKQPTRKAKVAHYRAFGSDFGFRVARHDVSNQDLENGKVSFSVSEITSISDPELVKVCDRYVALNRIYRVGNDGKPTSEYAQKLLDKAENESR